MVCHVVSSTVILVQSNCTSMRLIDLRTRKSNSRPDRGYSLAASAIHVSSEERDLSDLKYALQTIELFDARSPMYCVP